MTHSHTGRLTHPQLRCLPTQWPLAELGMDGPPVDISYIWMSKQRTDIMFKYVATTQTVQASATLRTCYFYSRHIDCWSCTTVVCVVPDTSVLAVARDVGTLIPKEWDWSKDWAETTCYLLLYRLTLHATQVVQSRCVNLYQFTLRHQLCFKCVLQPIPFYDYLTLIKGAVVKSKGVPSLT